MNRQQSSDISVIKEKLLGLARWRNVCHGGKVGLATLLASKQFCTTMRSWRFEDRCTAVLFGTTLEVAAYDPDSGEGMELYEAFISSVRRIEREGRRITGDLNVELGLMCTDEKDIEELNEMYGLLCWQGYDHDPGSFKKLMWCGIMKESNCRASFTWSRCGREREKRPLRIDNWETGGKN